tara:strand:+ start:269 stop:673 length:405 start_codon:yes stop_codon:yes gene_type:complete
MKILVFIVLLVTASPSMGSDLVTWRDVALQVNAELARAEMLFFRGDKAGAKKAVMEAYFGVFETEKMEAAMRTELGAKYTYRVERRFGAIRKAIKKDDGDAVRKISRSLRKTLEEDAAKLEAASIPRQVFKVNQ